MKAEGYEVAILLCGGWPGEIVEVHVIVRKDGIEGVCLADTLSPNKSLEKYFDAFPNTDKRYPGLLESAVADWHVNSSNN